MQDRAMPLSRKPDDELSPGALRNRRCRDRKRERGELPRTNAQRVELLTDALTYALQIIEAYQTDICAAGYAEAGFCQGVLYAEAPERIREALQDAGAATSGDVLSIEASSTRAEVERLVYQMLDRSGIR
jgi:hypothetical protein